MKPARKKNLFGLFKKKTVTVHRTGGVSAREIARKAYVAGQRSGDTGEFRRWVKPYEKFGREAVRTFEVQYRKGVERGDDLERSKKEAAEKKAERTEKVKRDTAQLKKVKEEVIEALRGQGMSPKQAKETVARKAAAGDSFESLFRKSVSKNPKNPLTAEQERLYRAAVAADDAFQKALVKKYGSRGGDMRYRTKELPPEIKALALKYQAAQEARRKSMSNPPLSVVQDQIKIRPAGSGWEIVDRKSGDVLQTVKTKSAAKQALVKWRVRFMSRSNYKSSKAREHLRTQSGSPRLKSHGRSARDRHKLQSSIRRGASAKAPGTRTNPGEKVIATLSQGGAKGEVYRRALFGEKFRAKVTKGTFSSYEDFKKLPAAMAWLRLRLHDVASTENFRSRKNPLEGALKVYEEFHGFPSDEIREYTEIEHYHSVTADVGKLVCIDVIIRGTNSSIPLVAPGFRFSNPELLRIDRRHSSEADRAGVHWEFTRAPESEIVMVTASEDRKQLFFTGGDQSVPWDKLGLIDRDEHDHMVIGEILELTYRTRKRFEADGKEEVDFHHEFGKQGSGGIRPLLLYFPRTKRMKVAGGRYYIAPPRSDIKASPGIVG